MNEIDAARTRDPKSRFRTGRRADHHAGAPAEGAIWSNCLTDQAVVVASRRGDLFEKLRRLMNEWALCDRETGRQGGVDRGPTAPAAAMSGTATVRCGAPSCLR